MPSPLPLHDSRSSPSPLQSVCSCSFPPDVSVIQTKRGTSARRNAPALQSFFLPELISHGSLARHIHLFRSRIMESMKNSLYAGGAGIPSGCQNAKIESLILSSRQSLECREVQ